MRHASKPKVTLNLQRRSQLAGCLNDGVMNRSRQNSGSKREIQPSEITARLERLADVRPAVVTRGKALIANPDYPSAKTLRAVAGVLARNWAP